MGRSRIYLGLASKNELDTPWLGLLRRSSFGYEGRATGSNKDFIYSMGLMKESLSNGKIKAQLRTPSRYSRAKFIITIGVFDGLHTGHRFILKEVMNKAREYGVSSLAITFWPHPQDVLKREFPGYIMNSAAKKKMLLNIGIDKVWLLRTTPGLLEMDGVSFMKKVAEKFIIEGMVIGEDFRFGYKSMWGINELEEIARASGFSLRVVRKLKSNNEVISSSLIRKFIHSADFERAKDLLGRDYVFEGRVIKGKGLGARMGFPTANVSNIDNLILPENGVYAAIVHSGRKSYLGAVNIGFNPTVQIGRIQSIEVHILNFSMDILNKRIKITFLEKIREEKKFSSIGSLKARINKDVNSISSKYNNFLRSCISR